MLYERPIVGGIEVPADELESFELRQGIARNTEPHYGRFCSATRAACGTFSGPGPGLPLERGRIEASPEVPSRLAAPNCYSG